MKERVANGARASIGRKLRASGFQLYRGALLFLSLQILGAFLMLGLHVIVARVIGSKDFGYYATTLALFNIAVAIGSGGQDTAVLRFVPHYIASGSTGRLLAFVYQSERRVVVVSTALSAIAIGAACLYQFAAGSPLTAAAIAAAFALPIQVLLIYLSAALRSVHKIVLSQLPIQVLQPVAVALLLICGSYVTNVATSAPAVHVATGIVALPLVIIARGAFRRSLPGGATSFQPGDTALWRSSSRALVLLISLQLISARIGIIVLGALRGPVEAGQFAVAIRISVFLSFGLLAINSWVAPTFAGLFAKRDFAGLQALVTRSSRLLLALTLPLAAVLALGGPTVLELFGSSFEDAYLPLLILLGGQAVTALTGPVGYLLTMSGHEATAARVEGSWALISLLSTVTLTVVSGVIGAAVAATISLVGRNLSMAIAVRRNLGLRVLPT